MTEIVHASRRSGSGNRLPACCFEGIRCRARETYIYHSKLYDKLALLNHRYSRRSSTTSVAVWCSMTRPIRQARPHVIRQAAPRWSNQSAPTRCARGVLAVAPSAVLVADLGHVHQSSDQPGGLKRRERNSSALVTPLATRLPSIEPAVPSAEYLRRIAQSEPRPVATKLPLDCLGLVFPRLYHTTHSP
jgi:hypothetical protein